MRTLFGTLFAIGLVLGATGCGGKSKNPVGAPASAAKADDHASGGATYGGATAPDNPCGAAKSDPCGGGE